MLAPVFICLQGLDVAGNHRRCRAFAKLVKAVLGKVALHTFVVAITKEIGVHELKEVVVLLLVRWLVSIKPK